MEHYQRKANLLCGAIIWTVKSWRTVSHVSVVPLKVLGICSLKHVVEV